jgi:DNA-binding GntR family transcriptional regulator
MKREALSKRELSQVDPEPGQSGGRRLADIIREDIVEGRLEAESRLVVAELAKRYGSSSNPIREALHQLQGEGIVVISHNRGARVRSVGEDFARNIYDIRALIEPYLARWFVGNATDQEIHTLDMVQRQIEGGHHDNETYRALNERFHGIVYNRHFNREAVEMEIRQREVLYILGRRFPMTRVRWQAITREHRGLIEAIRRHDADEAARITEQHVRGACEHLISQMRMTRAARDARDLRVLEDISTAAQSAEG